MSRIIHKPCVAIIGDMVRSRDLSQVLRPAAQRRFSSLIDLLNNRYGSSLIAKFVITLGDEFQGLIRAPETIPDLVWDIETNYADRDMRLGFGWGQLYTPVQEFAINVDGPALHLARAAIEHAKRKKKLGGVFEGFGESLDPILNGIAHLLRYHRAHLTKAQRNLFGLLRQDISQAEAAGQLGMFKQAVSKSARSAGWAEYHDGEEAWRCALRMMTPNAPN